MTKRVVVRGAGNVGRPAIRAVVAHRDLELVGVVVSNPAKRWAARSTRWKPLFVVEHIAGAKQLQR